ncbi:MAG: lipopolysaccharide heptosyltransferase I [Pyrinomonadaceae bacterium]|nr:lipopolysaccharide heptosyltransferase I [Acidobacteriota bacterium]MBK7933321.1 lipopolysaccharide heptosyltransferase I [Acidobacteriota bacterium]MBP7375279.1 lipopolysaccharide heptosyltransferase I [Pyrinomonadaceae bacterium]
MRILIVKLSSIGDIIHALPAVAAIRRALPEAQISWVVEARSAEIIRGCPLVDNLIEIDTRSIRGKVVDKIVSEISWQAKLIRKHKYDIAIDFQGLIKSAAIAKISGAKQRWGFAKRDLREKASRYFLTNTVSIEPKTHIIRKQLRLASSTLGFEYDDALIEFPIATTYDHRAEAGAIIARSGEKFAILNPAGGWVTKLWHAEKFGELADRIFEETGMISVVATAPNEVELAQTVVANSRTGKLILTQPSLKGFYELARQARIYVGGDTGPTHLAVAAGIPVVGLFGPTEWWRNGSLTPGDICVERTDITCRVDCHRRTCDNWICMDSDVDSVMAAVIRRISTSEPRPSDS